MIAAHAGDFWFACGTESGKTCLGLQQTSKGVTVCREQIWVTVLAFFTDWLVKVIEDHFD